MKPKYESLRMASGEPTVADTTGTAAPFNDKSPQRVVLDFHTPEFNLTDDLNDFSGECCAYEPLGDIVTADMRHQMERRRRGDMDDQPADTAFAPAETKAASDEREVDKQEAPLTVISEGRTLIVDTDAWRALACSRILEERQLKCTLLVTGSSSDASFTGHFPGGVLEADAVSIAGAFGGFSATATVKDVQRRLTGSLNGEASVFDLVLDLQPVTSYSGDLLPIGYYAPGPGAAALDEALKELPEMRGRFKKPQFTSFQEKRCFHGRSRTRDCRRCLDICPVGAIQSVNRKISVNPYLCQGCGGCTLVCPSNAIHLLEPSREDMLKALRSTLRLAGNDTPADLMISDVKIEDTLNGHVAVAGDKDYPLRFEVEQIGHVGLDIILAAFVYGARRVMVYCRAQNPPGIRKAVEQQTQLAGAVLKGLGRPEDSVRFTISGEYVDSEHSDLPSSGMDAFTGTAFMTAAPSAAARDQRTFIRQTVQHLYERSGVHDPRLPLPAGSSFGDVTVDTAVCTLCRACVTVCPSGALSAGGDVPRLAFRESRCHQCGLCEEVCPEEAVRLLSRLNCDPDAIEDPAVLHEAKPFRCIACGAPFASPAMVTRMEKKLAGHRMYGGERQMRRLRMCRTCRTRDALLSRDVNPWNR